MDSSNFDQAKAFFLKGLQHYEAGRYAQAEQQYAASLALLPGRASTLINLGAARLKLGRAEEALAVLEEALVQEPDSWEALAHQGTAQAELGRHEAALRSFDRSLALQPGQGLVWGMRGNVLREMGRLQDAAASFEKAIAHGGDPELNAFYLAALRKGETPAAMPARYVEALFDDYAAEFDKHVVQELGYDAPQVLTEGLAGRRFAQALDLGCGTGLCGPLLRKLCDRVDGADLSARMLEQARALGVYAQLDQAELVQHLQQTAQRYDLVVAADVFIYVGDLQLVFAGAARVMQSDGVFCFTVEEAKQDEVELRPSLRYGHSEAHVRQLARQHGFEVERIERRPVRHEQRVPIPGLFCWLRKRG
jgi:predicted TPR repeat methyltransferase